MTRDYDAWLYRGPGGPHDDRPDEDPEPRSETDYGVCPQCGGGRVDQHCEDCGTVVQASSL